MNTNYPRLILAGTHSSVGKTTLTLGLILALKKRGLNVQPFKAGPDYIDPSYHSLVSRQVSRNLDTWMLPKDVILELFQHQARLVDISIIEGVMGLYDGLKDTECGSTAHLAKILKAPVILIVDASSMSRSAAAVVLGYKEFDKEVDLRGIILNNIGSPSHYKSIKSSIEKKTGLPVLGYLSKDKDLKLPERHLGLIPIEEKAPLKDFLKRLTRLIEKNIEINKIMRIAQNAKALPDFKRKIFTDRNIILAGGCQDESPFRAQLFKITKKRARKGWLGRQDPLRHIVTIAIAKDAAFNFYYQDNLDLLEHYGAKLIEFSPLQDKKLTPGIDGLYIGGGFPELFAKKLAENTSFKKDILEKAKSGLPIYAECGGLMYLAKEIIDFRNRSFKMLGIFNARIKMAESLRALGYVDIDVLKDNLLSAKGAKMKAHVFHWSCLDNNQVKKDKLAYRVKKNKKSTSDGFIKWNVLASYTHLHFGSNVKLAKNFIRNCLEYKNKSPVCLS